MYSLEVIKSDRFQAQSVSKGNYGRESSFHFSSKGVVLHAASQRSTCFVETSSPWHSQFRYWIKQEQSAINGFIEAAVAGYEAPENACKQSRKGWKFREGKSKNGRDISAERSSGKLVERFTASSWEEIHYLTKP